MISEFLPPGIQVIALRSGYGVEADRLYTIRGFVTNRHWRTREPDPHVLFEEIAHPVGWPMGRHGEIGFPRCAFRLPTGDELRTERRLETCL